MAPVTSQAARLREFARARLVDFKVPRRAVVDDIPKPPLASFSAAFSPNAMV